MSIIQGYLEAQNHIKQYVKCLNLINIIVATGGYEFIKFSTYPTNIVIFEKSDNIKGFKILEDDTVVCETSKEVIPICDAFDTTIITIDNRVKIYTKNL